MKRIANLNKITFWLNTCFSRNTVRLLQGRSILKAVNESRVHRTPLTGSWMCCRERAGRRRFQNSWKMSFGSSRLAGLARVLLLVTLILALSTAGSLVPSQTEDDPLPTTRRSLWIPTERQAFATLRIENCRPTLGTNRARCMLKIKHW